MALHSLHFQHLHFRFHRKPLILLVYKLIQIHQRTQPHLHQKQYGFLFGLDDNHEVHHKRERLQLLDQSHLELLFHYEIKIDQY